MTLMRRLLLVVLVLGLLLVGGLMRFVDTVAKLPEPPVDQRTDGIVVLTGGSARLSTAIRLLDAGLAERLLISGVSTGASKASLAQSLSQSLPEHLLARPDRPGIDVPALFECCVDLGFEATDTAGNAVEALAWAMGRDMHSLRLVTANYHMPRALVEFRRLAGNTTILPHPVRPDFLRVESWWRHRADGLFLLGEYSKYVAALIRMRIEDQIDDWLKADS
jgi:uncharacterized SAM-binding protein YcdF (DUF218 family)